MQILPEQQIRLISSPTRLFSAASDFEGGNPKVEVPSEHANPSVGSWGASCARSHVAVFSASSLSPPRRGGAQTARRKSHTARVQAEAAVASERLPHEIQPSDPSTRAGRLKSALEMGNGSHSFPPSPTSASHQTLSNKSKGGGGIKGAAIPVCTHLLLCEKATAAQTVSRRRRTQTQSRRVMRRLQQPLKQQAATGSPANSR